MQKKNKKNERKLKRRRYKLKKRYNGKVVEYEKPEERNLLLIDGLPIYELGKFIEKGDFKKHLDAYKEDQEKIIKRFPKINKKERKLYTCQLIGKGNLLKLIHQPDCHAIRVYYGIKDDIPQLMLVGVYKNGKDMIDHTLILNETEPCPTICDDDPDV